MVGLERMLDYRGVGLARFHCICMYICMCCMYSNVYIRMCTYVYCTYVQYMSVCTSTVYTVYVSVYCMYVQYVYVYCMYSICVYCM